MSSVICTECEANILLDDGSEVGEILVCPECGVDLELISLDPAEVALAPMEVEDWGE